MSITNLRDNKRVPRPRAELNPDDLENIRAAQQERADAQTKLERTVAAAFANGASMRVITAETGIAGTTVLRYVNKHREN